MKELAGKIAVLGAVVGFSVGGATAGADFTFGLPTHLSLTFNGVCKEGDQLVVVGGPDLVDGGESYRSFSPTTVIAAKPGQNFAATYDGSTASWYADGVLMGSEAVTLNTGDTIHIDKRVTNSNCFAGLVDDVRLYGQALSAVQIRMMMAGGGTDVTVPGDVVRGVPNDGDWPWNEGPDLAIDDDVGTKYLHFKGDEGPSGLQITPAVGPTVVTGLTFTTANDFSGRDPIAFELYGSRDSIDGPYTLIASGDIVDFNGQTAWPRFTMNSTIIAFENIVAYDHYQLLFPAIRGPLGGSVDSMQIAEIELLAVVTGQTAAGLLAHWAFDETAGRLAPDSAGGIEGVLMGDPLWQPDGGKIDGALKFDGINDIVLTDFVLNPADGPFSVFAWVKGGAPGEVIVSQDGAPFPEFIYEG